MCDQQNLILQKGFNFDRHLFSLLLKWVQEVVE